MDPTGQTADPPPAFPRLGILGGGQLGLLLSRAGRELGVETTVLAPGPGPARFAADRLIEAALDDPGALEELVRHCDVVTFELEAIPTATLERLAAAERDGTVAVRPGAATLALLADKGLQKAHLQSHGVPVLPFALTDAYTTAASLASAGFNPPLVQKMRRGGYDGRGVQRLDDHAALGQLWPEPGLVEPLCAGCLEVAVLIVRDNSGRCTAYPPFSMDFDPALNAVTTVTFPAAVEAATLRRCEEVARAAVACLEGAGVFAVELFVSPAGEVYVNEISPRVHNSGHLTLEAFEHCQFEQHVRAVTGRPLAPVVPRASAAVMLNLLYDDSLRPLMGSEAFSLALDPDARATLHWYGKHEPRPGRKVGHITALGATAAEALARARAAHTEVATAGARIRRGAAVALAS